MYVSQYPDDVTSKFAYAALLIEIRELDKAEPIVDDLLALNENHPLLNTFKGIIESTNENYAKALKHLEIAVQNGRSDHGALGCGLLALTKYKILLRNVTLQWLRLAFPTIIRPSCWQTVCCS